MNWLGKVFSARSFLGFPTRIYLLSGVVGLISGLGAVLFSWGLELVSYLCVEVVAGFDQVHAAGGHVFDFSFWRAAEGDQRLWLLLLLPGLGALISGFLVFRFAPEAEGPGTDAMIDSFHNQRGIIRPIVPLVKAVATIFTLGSGGSAGKEGPLVHIGAGLGSWIGTRLRLSADQRRLLLLAGTAGGLGAVFRAPLGGAVTSVEVLYREDFEGDALVPCVISSIVAYLVYTFFLDSARLFAIPVLNFSGLNELWVYLVLALLCALCGILYIKILTGFRTYIFQAMDLPRYWVVALGGLLVGVLGFIDLRVLGSGFGVLQQGIDGRLALGTLAMLALLKILATACTASSGGSGGFFGPSLFIGGMLGGAVGGLAHVYFPTVVTQPAAYVVVGMAGFLATVAKTPLAVLIIVVEMTGGYQLLPPLMLVCVVGLIATRRFSVYNHQVQNKFHSPAHLKDFTIDVLKGLPVHRVFPALKGTNEAVISNDLPYFSLHALSRRLGHLHFVVLRGDGQFRGMLRLDDLELPEDELLKNLLLVEDMSLEEVEPILVSDNLHRAMEKLLSSGFDKLPVMEEGVFLGYMQYQDVLQAYHEEVARLERQD